MTKIQESLRQHASGGLIRLSDALEIGKEADDLLKESVEFLKDALPNLGMLLRGDIEKHISKITKRRYPDQVYYSDREPEGQ